MTDEERAREIGEHAGIDMLDDHDLFIAEMTAALTAVRAEAAQAEREACAKRLEHEAGRHEAALDDIYLRDDEYAMHLCAATDFRSIAAAIRARK